MPVHSESAGILWWLVIYTVLMAKIVYIRVDAGRRAWSAMPAALYRSHSRHGISPSITNSPFGAFNPPTVSSRPPDFSPTA